jgi:hypothetical protein
VGGAQVRWGSVGAGRAVGMRETGRGRRDKVWAKGRRVILYPSFVLKIYESNSFVKEI